MIVDPGQSDRAGRATSRREKEMNKPRTYLVARPHGSYDLTAAR